mmetsp:Transcript_9149/g.16065  ORF Transcript_9149/g.16065 Transcript_9149/m.16065 type:complete len:461 (+) Transcript_9149:302-1684(+)
MTSLAFGRKFTQFVDGSPTPFHCVQSAVKRLEAVGFKRLHENKKWKEGAVEKGGLYYYTRNGSSLIAFTVGEKFDASTGGFKLVGAHTDSPALKVKPISKRSSVGFLQVGAEVYGGGIWHTWLDRDLGIAGRCIVKKGDKFKEQLVHIARPILRVPTLAIHLQSADERAALKLNKEDHLEPILGLINKDLNGEGLDERHAPELLMALADQLGCEPTDIVDLELTLCDTQTPSIGGNNNEFIFSPRLDNQMHCFTSVEALADYSEGGAIAEDQDISIVCLFDHEEVGSQSAVGAGSPMMRDAMERIASCFADDPETYDIMLTKSFLVSADGAHSIHPNYAHKHEKQNAPKLGAGTVIKTNDNQRYATNAISGFLIRELARRAGIPIQEFVVRNDCPCGTTIGPILASLTGARTIDIGVPQLSMHSIRETCAVADMYSNYELLKTFFESFRDVDEALSTEEL